MRYIILYIEMQEVGSYRPAVRPERRRAMQREIVASAPHALQVLASCLNLKGQQLPHGSLPHKTRIQPHEQLCWTYMCLA